jgi:hypothetical protein
MRAICFPGALESPPDCSLAPLALLRMFLVLYREVVLDLGEFQRLVSG